MARDLLSNTAMLYRYTITAGLVLFILVTGERSAAAQQEHHHANVVGLKGMEVNHLEGGHNEIGSGIGIFYEHALIERWLELEICAIRAQVHGQLEVPFDLVAKVPIELTHSVTAFVGGGTTLTFEEEEDGWSTHYGVVLVAGLYVWPSEHWGLDIEVDYKHLAGSGNSHEVELAAGPAYRF